MNFEIKGLDFIINALGKLKSRKYSFRLLVAGKGNTSKYTRLAQQTGVAENIIFTGKLDKRNLIRHYLASDIYIMLSAFDTFGMVVLEAMAAGLPVIISSNVGAKDLVRENENGFVIADTSNTEIVADKIERLLDKNTHWRMSRAASATASQNTWDHVVEKYVQIYREVLQNKQKN
ncbi:MAG: GDP-mannose-dependent alpha-(1-6)-phosphatidylinositol monomannoside mannosyltransferase [Deltaproteobacteria bacterium ADurb.BinA014]|nr:MAG: GDP-mannose-dependent alpha-(1-6)-phosphatidylinositol monomannoside mannosyltransferase [Deltaproteobacteria bacterium ADurb.BinA014]